MLRLLGSVFSMAWRNLLAHKLRSFLTVLGLFIGISGVIAIVGAGEGVKDYFRGAIGDLGDDLLFVQPQAAREEGRVTSTAEPFEQEDLEFLANNANTIEAIDGSASGEHTLKFLNNTRSYTVRGRSEIALKISKLELNEGRGFTPSDLKGRARVAVLGSDVARELYPENVRPLGTTLNIDGSPFRVVGVLQEQGRIGGAPDWDSSVLVPLTTYQSRIAGSDDIGWINIMIKEPEELGVADSAAAVDRAKQEITRLLRIKRNIKDPTKDDFLIITPQDFLELGSSIINVMVQVFGIVALVALLVGSIGVMNIMLVSVQERTREIGLRKAIGAPKRAILTQFMIESVVLSLMGGVLGFLVGLAGAFGLNALFTEMGIFGTVPIQTTVPWNFVVLTIGVSILVGLAAGVWPAMKAANLDPIEALRYE